METDFSSKICPEATYVAISQRPIDRGVEDTLNLRVAREKK